MTRTLSKPHRSRREIREDVKAEVLDALRVGGEQSSRDLAGRLGIGLELVGSVCRELEFCHEIRSRKPGRASLWRLPDQRPDAELREVLALCRERMIDAEPAVWHGQPRVRAPHPFGDGWVWIDGEHDVAWYTRDRRIER